MKIKKNSFGVYFDSTKITSGQRFFELLTKKLSENALPLDKNPKVVLFNISAPILQILLAKLKFQKIVIRVDGLYFDNLSLSFLSTFPTPIRLFLSLGLKFKKFEFFFTFLANLISENYTSFIRILFADHIIYQSYFSYKVHKRYFTRKKFSIILNGAEYEPVVFDNNIYKPGDLIKVVTIYDEWRPSKRINELIRFIKWVNENCNEKIELSILGYSGKHSICFTEEDISYLQNSNYIKTTNKFKKLSELDLKIIKESHAYITFTYRDSCPNTVIESMAFGLPVLAIKSGGLPEIVNDAGILINSNDFEKGYYTAHRYGCSFPDIDYRSAFIGLKEIAENQLKFRSNISKRFENELSIQQVALKYEEVLKSLI